MELFGVGIFEIMVIMVVALVVIGPERLPEVASQVGRTVADLKRQASQLTSEFQQSLDVATQERKEQRLTTTTTPPLTATTTPLTATTTPLATRYCDQCGAAMTAEARFCASCGAAGAARVPDGDGRLEGSG